MQIIATVPAPYREDMVKRIASHLYVDAVRFNTGARSDVPPLQTLQRLTELIGDKDLWIDLKGRQLRIKRWAMPDKGTIVLNHNIRIFPPSSEDEIIFRNGTQEGFRSRIVSVRSGNRVFVDPPPKYAVGDGQSINIHAKNLFIKGYLTAEDEAYIRAANELGLKNFMLSFVEKITDFTDLLKIIPDANIALKIESPKGLALLDQINFEQYENVRLMVARDDLLINLSDRSDIISETRRMLEFDPRTIVASRILTSTINQDDRVNGTPNPPSLGDIADLTLLQESGCFYLMLCDDLCQSSAFGSAMEYLVRR